jgi:hypothetical protein
MKTYLLAAAAAGLFLTGCGDDSSKKTAQATNAPAKYDTGNPLTAPGDYLGVVVQAKTHSEKVIDVAYINQAIQLFNASEGRFPKTLDELVPNYLGKMPETPFGTKLAYDATAGTVKVVKQ